MAGTKKSKVKKKKMMGGKKTKVAKKMMGGKKTKIMKGGKKAKIMKGGKKTKVNKLRGGMKTKVKKMAVGKTPPISRGPRGSGQPPRVSGGSDFLPKPSKPPVRKPVRGQKVKPKGASGRKDSMGRNMMAAGGVGKLRKGMKAGKVVSFQDYVKSMFGGGKT